jgi:hypothetical protein
MSQFLTSVRQGLAEGPLIFCAPIVALWRACSRTAVALLRLNGRS